VIRLACGSDLHIVAEPHLGVDILLVLAGVHVGVPVLEPRLLVRYREHSEHPAWHVRAPPLPYASSNMCMYVPWFGAAMFLLSQ
jgi:hypothetical protein